MITGPAVVTLAPSKMHPHIFVVVDASTRMDVMFPTGTTKWAALHESIQSSLLFAPNSKKYRLIILGGNQAESTRSCNQKENKIILDNRNTIVETIENLQTGGVASLNDALMKIRDVLSNIPDEQKTMLYLFLGGGDECAKNAGDDEWNDLRYFLVGVEDLFDKLHIEIILLPSEGETISGASEIYKTIDKYKLTNVEVHSPENADELEHLIEQFGNNTRTSIPVASQSPIPSDPTTPSTFVSTKSSTPTKTRMPADTLTPVPAVTPKNTSTPTDTPTLTYTPTPTDTPTLTYTPTPTDTPTLTYTPTPTDTPTPTHTSPPPPNCVT